MWLEGRRNIRHMIPKYQISSWASFISRPLVSILFIVATLKRSLFFLTLSRPFSLVTFFDYTLFPYPFHGHEMADEAGDILYFFKCHKSYEIKTD